MFLILNNLANIESIQSHNKFHLIIDEKDFLENLPKFDSIVFINEVCYEGTINNIYFKILVISSEYFTELSQFYNNIHKNNFLKLPSIIGNLFLIKTSYNEEFVYCPKEILKLIINIANNINYKTESMDRIKEYIDGILIRESFFQGYTKKRYVAHDRIHRWVAQSLGLERPTVTDLLYKHTQVRECDFNNLSISNKEYLLVEEAIVLAFERTLIRETAETSKSINELIEKFFTINNENTSLIRLQELSTPGQIKDHPDWMAMWAKNHGNKLEQTFFKCLLKSKDNFPISAKNYLYFLKKYNNTKQIDNSFSRKNESLFININNKNNKFFSSSVLKHNKIINTVTSIIKKF